MNAAQQELVRTSFARLAVMPEVAGALFYERLFATNPRFRPLFKNDMRIQGVKLMAMLAMVVYNLPEPGRFRLRSVILPSVMSSMASYWPTMTRCGKRCCGPSNRRLGRILRPPSVRRGWSATTNSPMR